MNADAKLCANPRNKQRGDSIEHQQQHEDSAEIRSALILPEIRNKRNEERAITKEETAGNKNVVRAGKKVRFSERVQVEFR